MKGIRLIFLSTCMLAVAYATSAQNALQLPGYFSDSMVLQRDQPVVISGTAAAGRQVKVALHDKTATAKADRTGRWQVTLPAMPAGGPFTLRVSAGEVLELKGIMLGDLWFCSGQSNMEWKLGWLEKERTMLAAFHNPQVRLLTMPHRMAGGLLEDTPPLQWHSMHAGNAADYSAVAVYFARYLQPAAGVAQGIIISAWGGTDIEAWMSKEALSKLDKHRISLEQLHRITDADAFANQAEAAQKGWEDSLRQHDPGTVHEWYKPDADESGWEPINIPGTWNAQRYPGQGNGWFRRYFDISEGEAGADLLLSLGKLQNQGRVFVNGVPLQESIRIGMQGIHVVPAKVLRPGRNNLAVQITFLYGAQGGFLSPAKDVYAATAGRRIPLAGEWRFKPGYLSRNPALINGPNNYPSSLFNGMVYPFTRLAVKGVLWYQGENNTSRPQDYAWHLSQMIAAWRSHWRQTNLPFIVVQLPNFIPQPHLAGNYAVLRGAQAAAAREQQAALAVTIDIGDSMDIHPVNKADVGQRLAWLARRWAYHDSLLVASGPVFHSVHTEGDKVFVRFSETGSGLMTKDKYSWVTGFELAGPDGRFHWAQGFIDGERVLVSSPAVASPVQLRYAWADNPDLGLFNREGLSAAPFFVHLLPQPAPLPDK